MHQPQWSRQIPVRNYKYAHTQPQWSYSTQVISRCPLALTRVCASCHQVKQQCKCHTCFNCRESMNVRTGGRHHCRKCWQAVCGRCWTKIRYVHMLGEPVQVCDACALPYGITFLCCRREQSLQWGLYALQMAADMPKVCITPSCSSITYGSVCRNCGLPTVQTRPHEERSIRVTERTMVKVEDSVKYLEAREFLVRSTTVDNYKAEELERSFRACFPQFQEAFAFTALSSARDAQEFLLSIICAEVSYEYRAAPNLTLSLNYTPYSRLLKITHHNAHFSVFEAPGKVMFISFPGTHNYRTFLLNLHCGQIKTEVWSGLVDSFTVSDLENSEYQKVHGGFLKTWEYCVHQGFAREADSVVSQIEKLVRDAIDKEYRLVFSGHSLGGAIAQLVTFRMLLAHPGILKERLKCFSIGAPLVGNYQLAKCIEQCGWWSNFHNVVYRSDVIPRLLCVDKITRALRDKFIRGLSTLRSSVQGWFTSNSTVKEESESITAAVDSQIKEGKDLFEMEDTPSVGNNTCEHCMYTCFGRYHFLNHRGVRYFSTDDSKIAFHRLKEGCGSETNVRDHSISTYNRAILLHLYSA